MALYKAKESYKTAKNKFFGIHKIKNIRTRWLIRNIKF